MPEWFIAAQAEKRTRAALMRRFKQGFGSVDARGCTKLTTLNAGKAGSVDARGCTSNLKIIARKGALIYR